MVDVSRAHSARVHDVLLGGTDNYESDRIAVARILDLESDTDTDTAEVIRGSRTFLLETVRRLARYSRVGQFIELGCGLPTRRTVHGVAQRARRDARVVYVDNDRIVLDRGRMLLEENAQTRVIRADLRHGAGEVFARVQQTQEGEQAPFLDPGRPSAALLSGILEELDDDAAARLVGDVRAHLAPGSHVVVSHLTSQDQGFRRKATQLMNDLFPGGWGRVRSPQEVAGLLTGLTLTRPLRDVTTWHSRQAAGAVPPFGWIAYGGTARIPAADGISPKR